MMHAEQLDAIPREHLAALGERLRAAGARDDVRAALEAPPMVEGRRRAVLAHRLRRLRLPEADLARLFVARAALDDAEAADALGATLRDELVADGVLRREDGRVRSQLGASLTDGAIVEPAEFGAVALAQALGVRARRALAFGGDLRACALPADELFAYDPRPRVGAVLRANAALVGRSLETWERLADDLPEFDLVTVDLRFDDPVERVALSRAVSALAPGGTLCAVVEAFDPGLLEVLTPPEPIQLVAFGLPSRPIEDACALRAAALEPALGEAHAQAFESAMATWAARRVSQLSRGLLVVRRAAPSFRVPHGVASADLARFPFARVLASCALAHAPDDELLAAEVRIPAGARTRPHEDQAAMRPPMMDDAILLGPVHAPLVLAAHHERSVRAAIEALCRASQVPFERAVADLLPAVRESLRTGLLEVSR